MRSLALGIAATTARAARAPSPRASSARIFWVSSTRVSRTASRSRSLGLDWSERIRIARIVPTFLGRSSPPRCKAEIAFSGNAKAGQEAGGDLLEAADLAVAPGDQHRALQAHRQQPGFDFGGSG